MLLVTHDESLTRNVWGEYNKDNKVYVWENTNLRI